MGPGGHAFEGGEVGRNGQARDDRIGRCLPEQLCRHTGVARVGRPPSGLVLGQAPQLGVMRCPGDLADAVQLMLDLLGDPALFFQALPAVRGDLVHEELLIGPEGPKRLLESLRQVLEVLDPLVADDRRPGKDPVLEGVAGRAALALFGFGPPPRSFTAASGAPPVEVLSVEDGSGPASSPPCVVCVCRYGHDRCSLPVG